MWNFRTQKTLENHVKSILKWYLVFSISILIIYVHVWRQKN